MADDLRMRAYVCPQCGPDPSGGEMHTHIHHGGPHPDEDQVCGELAPANLTCVLQTGHLGPHSIGDPLEPIAVVRPCLEPHRTDMVCLDCAGPRAERAERHRIERNLLNGLAESRYELSGTDQRRIAITVLRGRRSMAMWTNSKSSGRWYKVTHGCSSHVGFPIHECDGCQQATDAKIMAEGLQHPNIAKLQAEYDKMKPLVEAVVRLKHEPFSVGLINTIMDCVNEYERTAND